MAGDGEDRCMFVLLLFITVFMRLAFIRRRSRFEQRLRLLAIRSKMRRTDACSLQLQRKFRKKKIAWVLERPQFWFEHMVSRHCKTNIWREHFRISRQTFRFLCDLVRPHLARQDDKQEKSDSTGEASSCCFVAPRNRKFLPEHGTSFWSRTMYCEESKRRISFSASHER